MGETTPMSWILSTLPTSNNLETTYFETTFSLETISLDYFGDDLETTIFELLESPTEVGSSTMFQHSTTEVTPMYLSYANIETVTTVSSSAKSMTTNPTNLVHLTSEEFSVASITFNDSFVYLINDSSSVTNRLHPDDGNLHFKEEVSVITELNPNVADTKEDTTTFVNIDGEAMTKNFELDIDLQGFLTESKVGFE